MGGVVFAFPPPEGGSRWIDYSLDHQSGVAPGTVVGASAMRGRAGTGAITNLITTVGSPTWATIGGRQAISIPASAGAGVVAAIGSAIATTRLASGAIGPRMYVYRFSSVAQWPSAAAAADVGSLIKIASTVGTALSADLTTEGSTTGSGVPGFGVLQTGVAGVWNWVNKKESVAGFSETVALSNTLSDGAWHTIEHRIYDATNALEARYELWIDNTLILVRYWTNPSGVGSVVLPPLSATAGFQLFATIKNAVSGGVIALGEYDIMFGSPDRGTIAPSSS